MFVKEKDNEIYDTAKNVLIEDDINPLNEIIENAVKKGDFRNDLPGEFIIKIISHLFTHFEDVFNSEDDMELGNIIKNLDYYVDFMKNGLDNKITREDI